jgi:ParB family chromosome partitioning protein
MSQTEGTVVLVETVKLLPCKLNPRQEFRGIERLAESIKREGIIEPLLVRLLPEGPEVICGERRRRAALQAGLPKVPVIIRDLNDQQVIEICLIEEIESEEYTELEKGLASIRLKTEFRQTYPNNKSLAQRFGVSEDTIQRWIQIASGLPIEIQKLLPKEAVKRGSPNPPGTITHGIALRIVRKIKDPERQLALAEALAQEGIPEANARGIVDEAAACPEEPMAEAIRGAAETPTLTVSPEQAEIFRKGAQDQLTWIMTIKDERIKEGQTVDLYTKFAEVQVVSLERKAHWMHFDTVGNLKGKVIKFSVTRLVASTPAAPTR